MKERNFESKRLAIKAYNSGTPPEQLARTVQVHLRTIFRWLSAFRAGKTANSPRGHRPRSLGPEEEKKLEALVLEKPGRTLDELCAAMGYVCERTTLNLIEKMWSKVREKIRSLAPPTYEALIKAIGTAWRTVTPPDAKGWFASSGCMAI